MIKALLLTLGLIGSAYGQTQQPPAVITQFLGVNQNDPSVSIGNEAQDALNVESSLNGTALLKRYGYSRIASLTVSTSAPSGSYSFVDPNGNNQQIVCQDHNCAKSTNSSAFTVFLSTAGGTCMPTLWQFAQIGGFIYAVNDCHDTPWRYDGTTRSDLLGSPPLGSIIEATKDRLVISGVSASPSNVYYSQSGTPTNFVTGINSADPYIDPVGAQGDRVRALKYSLGRFFIFKTNSITSCILGDQYTSKCFPVSNSVGTSDPLSVVEVPGTMTPQGMTSGAVLFRGSDGNYWSLDQTGLNVISKKLSGLVAAQNGGSSQSNTQTSQADWNAGTQFGLGTWNTVSSAGSIVASTVVFASTGATASDWTMVDIDTSFPSVSPYVSNNDGQTLDAMWTVVAGTISVSLGSIVANTPSDGSSGAAVCTPSSVSTGIWSLVMQSTAISNGDIEYWNVAGDTRTDNFNGGAYVLQITQSAGARVLRVFPGALFQITPNVSPAEYDGNAHAFIVSVATNGFIEVLRDGVIISTGVDTHGTIPRANYSCIKLGGSPGATHASKIRLNGFYANQESIPYYVGATTPTWGIYSIGLTSATSSSVTFRAQVAAASAGPYAAFVTPTNGAIFSPASLVSPYFRNGVIFSAPTSTFTPTYTSFALTAGATGQFVTPCIQPGAGITSWGQLSCAQTNSQGGSLVYYATSAANCASLPTSAPINATGATNSGWTAQTNNATMTISTNAAVLIGFRSLLTSATDQAQVDACTLYWTNGTASQPSWGTFDPVKNAVYWTASINNSATANRVLKYDLNLNEWYPFGLNATAIFRDSNQNAIYFGDSTGGYWNKYGGISSDNGAAINAYWISRDFGGATPFVDNNYDRISLVTKNQVTGSMTVAYSMTNGDSGSYSVSLSTTASTVYVHSNAALTQSSPAQFMNINLGNNSTNGFEVDALSLDLSSWGWNEQNP